MPERRGLGLLATLAALALAGGASDRASSRFDRLPYVVIIGREDGEERTLFVRLVDRGRFASGYGYRTHPMDGGAGGTRASAHSPNSTKGLAALCDL